MKRSLSVLIRVVVSFGLLGLLFWIMRDDIRDILGKIMACNKGFILFSVGVLMVNVTALAYRLKIVFKGEDLAIPLKKAFQLTCVGYFFNNFMPTAVGGDVVKAHYASQFNKERVRSYASVLMDRFIGLYSFLIFAAIALVIDRGKFQVATVRPLVFMLLFFGVLISVVVTNRRVALLLERFFGKIKMFRLGEKLQSIYDIVHDYRNRKDVIGKSVLVSLVAQSLYFLVIYLFFRALGREVSIGNIFLIMPLVTFISMIPSIGGLGVREGAMVTFFAPLVGKELAFAVSLFLVLGLFLIGLVGGIIFLWWGFTGITREKPKTEG